jgi:putative transposase
MASDRKAAEPARAVFEKQYGAKYAGAVESLTKDRDALLGCYDFPAEHWDHGRTTKPLARVFAAVRHRMVRTNGARSQVTATLMVFKLIMAASKTWRRLQGENQVPKVIRRVHFRDGIEVTEATANGAACAPHHPNAGIPPHGRINGLHGECASGSGSSAAGMPRYV